MLGRVRVREGDVGEGELEQERVMLGRVRVRG
jgi:hypothetical protein